LKTKKTKEEEERRRRRRRGQRREKMKEENGGNGSGNMEHHNTIAMNFKLIRTSPKPAKFCKLGGLQGLGEVRHKEAW
jgi:hypothetical protein